MSKKLADDIEEEFLICKICLEQYKDPKSLACLHTFCEACIENHAFSEQSYKKYSDYRDFTCPLCRKRTQLPPGGCRKLPDNFLISSLMDVVNRQKPATDYPFCEICKAIQHRTREAPSKCIDCSKLLCKHCVDQHRETRVTRNHNIIDIQAEKDITCKEHSTEVVRFYCIPCEACVCIMCTFNEHKDHEISSFCDAVAEYKDDINSLLEDCKSKLYQIEKRMDGLGSCEKCLDETEQLIRDNAISFISAIRTREKELLDELHSFYAGLSASEVIKRKGELQVEYEGLKQTVGLTELVLKGRDMELLLLRSQVQEKLLSIANVDMKSIPSSFMKQVRFVPGQVDLGYIQDCDKPLVSLNKARATLRQSLSTDSFNAILTEVKCQESQTDPRITAGIEQNLQTNVYELVDRGTCPVIAFWKTQGTMVDSDLEGDDDETQEEEEEEDSGEAEEDDYASAESVTEERHTEDKSVNTDVVEMVERGVNTRCRAIMRQSRQSMDSGESSTGSEMPPLSIRTSRPTLSLDEPIIAEDVPLTSTSPSPWISMHSTASSMSPGSEPMSPRDTAAITD